MGEDTVLEELKTLAMDFCLLLLLQKLLLLNLVLKQLLLQELLLELLAMLLVSVVAQLGLAGQVGRGLRERRDVR